MTEIDRIRQQMKQAFTGEAWHGPSLTELLVNVDATTAANRPIPERHTIWEIVLHLQTTQELILDRLRGIARPFTPGDEWPPAAETTEEAWQEAMAKLEAGDQDIRDAVAQFPDEHHLDEPLVEGGTSAYNNFHGYVQHSIYHAGQISILKKLTEAL